MKQRNNDCFANLLIIISFSPEIIFINYIFEHFAFDDEGQMMFNFFNRLCMPCFDIP